MLYLLSLALSARPVDPQSGQVDSQSGQVDPQSGQVDRQKDTKEQTKSAYKTSRGFVRTLLPDLQCGRIRVEMGER